MYGRHPCARLLEFEKNAADCRQLAASTPNQVQKQKLLAMADAWARFTEDPREQLTEQPVNGHFLLNEFADQLN